MQLVHANISCNVWCCCSVPQLPGHFASVSMAFLVHMFLAVWMCNVTAGEGTFSPWDVGRRLARWKPGSSRLALTILECTTLSAPRWLWCLWLWANPLLLQQLVIGSLADVNAELQLSSCCPFRANLVLELCSLLCPQLPQQNTYFLFLFVCFKLEPRHLCCACSAVIAAMICRNQTRLAQLR